MKIGGNTKFYFLAAVVFGVMALLWHRSREPVTTTAQAPPTPASKPAVQSSTTAPAPTSTPLKSLARTPESMADAAYRASVLANQVKREELLLALVADMTPENAAPFLEELMRSNRTPLKPGQTVWNAFWRKWGSIDGKSCMDELIARGQKNRITTDGVLAMEGWAAADPQGAAEWLKSEQPSVAIWNAAWAAYQINVQGGDPLAASAEILSAADTPTKMDALCQQLADLAQLKKGAEGLLEWFSAVPDDKRTGAVNHFLFRLISSDPQQAVNFMTQNAQAAWRDDRHAGKLISEISKQDPAGTATWASRLYPSPNGTPQEQSPVFQATLHWAKADPAAAKAWLEANAQQPWAEMARSGYANGAPAEESDSFVSPP
jgi:hypothetical protein